MQSEIRGTLNSSLLLPENPVHIFYGQGDWAASLGYSQIDRKTSDAKETFLKASFGIDKDDFEVWANIDLVQSAKTGTLDYKGSPGVTVGAEKHFSQGFYLTGNVYYLKSDVKNGATNRDGDIKGLEVTFFDRNIKGDKYSIYYGPGLNYFTWDLNGPDINVTSVPVYIGLQYQLKDWIELRSSLSQNFIFGSQENETATAPNNKKDSIGNNTKMTLGAGVMWNELTFDFVATGTTGPSVPKNFVADVNGALTFNF